MQLDLTPQKLTKGIERLSTGSFLQDPFDALRDALELLQAPERLTTVECAEKYRVLPGKESGAIARYDRWRTPYNVGPQNSLDDTRCKLLVMVKPSRSGGTTVAENYLFKLLMFGPVCHVSWYLNNDEAVNDYCKQVVKPMFDLNEDLQRRVGGARGDNTDTFKRVAGYPIEWLSAKDSTFRNREPGFMVSDETDAWNKKFAATPKIQIDGRQKQLGHRRKGAIMSHADLGWNSGVGACFEDSSRGIYVMQCSECGGHAAAYATKFWDNVPEFKLSWTRNEDLENDERIALAEKSASLICPHCGSALNDEQRLEMIDAALDREDDSRDGWMHRGQTLDVEKGVIGDPDNHETHGYWVHGTMLKTEDSKKLARGYESALIKFERTRDSSQLKEFMSKQLGEIFEGAATTGGVSARVLKQRARDEGFDRGVAQAEVKFITAAIDPGRRMLDVLFTGWDLLGNSWLIDRLTIRQTMDDEGRARDIDLYSRVSDWDVIIPQVVDRQFPIAGKTDLFLPVAVTCLDNSDGNVTWKAREFARRSISDGHVWNNWSKIKLIKGQDGKRPILPEAPTRVDKDERGKQVEPALHEYRLGVDALKAMTLERLALGSDDSGFVHFHREFESYYVDQFFGETYIDGKWKRHGPNESLDLYGYSEAGRLLLAPDREDIAWDDPDKRPIWARPISLQPKGGDQTAEIDVSDRRTIFDRFDELNN